MPNGNPCEDGGGCQILCLLAPDFRKTCSCPDNFVLESDGKSCKSNCSASHMVCNSTYKCIPKWWKCDGRVSISKYFFNVN